MDVGRAASTFSLKHIAHLLSVLFLRGLIHLSHCITLFLLLGDGFQHMVATLGSSRLCFLPTENASLC